MAQAIQARQAEDQSPSSEDLLSTIAVLRQRPDPSRKALDCRVPVDFGLNPFMKEYRGLIIKTAGRYADPSTEEFRDLCQSGVQGLYEAKKSYRKGRGTKLSTWAYIAIRDRIQRQHALLNSPITISYQTAAKKKPLTANIDDSRMQLPDTRPGPDQEALVKEDSENNARITCNMWRALNHHLTKEERSIVLDHFVKGVPVRELSRKYGRPVHPVLKAAKEKMRASLRRPLI